MSGNFINNPAVLVPQLPQAAPPQSAPLESETRHKETVTAYLWNLQTGSSNNARESDIPCYSQSMPRVHKSDPTKVESIIDVVDERTLVSQFAYNSADGPLRGIVKLFLLFEGQVGTSVKEDEATWATATGWLAASDVVITAGHCAYDHTQNLGRLVKVKAYVGYSGKDSVKMPSVEFRYGAAVTTPKQWIDTSGGYQPADVALVKLTSSFNSVGHCFEWVQTPISQTGADLGVIGYPGDIMDDKGERGALMYQMFKRTDYSLETSGSHMLQYKIDTYGGNSGSPVFNDENTYKVIGVHVLGGYAINSASVISGPYGNRIYEFLKILSSLTLKSPINELNPFGAVATERSGVWIIETSTSEFIDDSVRAGLMETKKAATLVEEHIPDTILDPDVPLRFGNAGSQVGILAAAAIAAAGTLAADSKKEFDVENLANTRSYDGIIGRAIVAEAALQHFQSLTPGEQETLTESLGPTVAALKPFVLNVAPKLLKGTFEPSMRILLSNMIPVLDNKRKRVKRSVKAEIDTGFGRTLTEQEAKFLDGLMKDVQARPVTAESFFSTLTTIGDIIGSAFKKAGPILANVAKAGLSLLQEVGTGESQLHSSVGLDPLAHRAILAEACLQAFIALPENDPLQEGLFSDIVDGVVKFGPKVIRAAPFIAKTMGPVVADVLRQINSQKGSLGSNFDCIPRAK